MGGVSVSPVGTRPVAEGTNTSGETIGKAVGPKEQEERTEK